MTEATLRQRLDDAFSAHPLEGDLPHAVWEALDAFVVECRDGGDPPERVLLKLKAIIADVRPATRGSMLRFPTRGEQAFTDRLIAQCITSYFDRRPDPPGS